jgi:hypothetical protein
LLLASSCITFDTDSTLEHEPSKETVKYLQIYNALLLNEKKRNSKRKLIDKQLLIKINSVNYSDSFLIKIQSLETE